MSNFTAFQTEYLKSIIEPFLPGGTEHITPIKFEALTPDIFAFLFRTTAKDNSAHFFVALKYDHLSDIEEARIRIEQWHGSFLEFWAPESNPKAAVDLQEVSAPVDKVYKVLLAKVESPTPPSYWSDAKVLWSDDNDLDAFLTQFPASKREAVRKNLLKIRQESPEANISVHIDQFNHEHFYYN